MRLGVRIGLFLTALAAAGAVLVVAAVIAAYFYLAPSLPDAQELREVRRAGFCTRADDKLIIIDEKHQVAG